MATTAAAGHSGTKDFHQVQYSSRVLVTCPTDANAGAGVVAANSVGGEIDVGEGINTVGTVNNSNNNNNNNNNTNNNTNKNRMGQSMKNQLLILKPDTLFNGTGIFTVYCFVKDFIGASGTSAVAIDNKIEQAMDLVKSHLMIAVREEVEVLKEKISELMDKINQLEVENTILKANMSQETLHQLQIQAQLQIAGSGGTNNMITQAPPPNPQQQQQQQGQQPPPQQQQQQPQQQAPPPQQQQQQAATQQPQQAPQQQQQQQAPPTNPTNTTNGPLS